MEDGTVNKIKHRVSGCNKKSTLTNQQTNWLFNTMINFFPEKKIDFQLVNYALFYVIQSL
jgi:hypothetical protein